MEGVYNRTAAEELTNKNLTVPRNWCPIYLRESTIISRSLVWECRPLRGST